MAPKRPGISIVSKPTLSPSSGGQPIMMKDLQHMMGDVITQIRAEMKKILEENNKILRQDFVLALKGVASVLEKVNSYVDEVAEKVEIMEGKIESMEKEMENEILMLQYGQMESALRIRGLGESLQGDLKKILAKDFALILNKEKEGILSEIEKLFRVNSVVAAQKNLPRDVVIYFGKRALRNEIVQAFYKKRFQIASQDVIIFKEIPSKILRRRKEFAFLANELKQRKILFRWDVPTGMVVNYLGTCYRLNTVSQAKDFYTLVLGVRASPSVKLKVLEEKNVESQFEEPIFMKAGEPLFERPQQVLVEEQKTTCVVHTCKEKQQQKKRPQQVQVEEQKTTCAAHNCKEKQQQKKVKEVLYVRPQRAEMEEQRTCAAHNGKDKDQQKKLKEGPQEMKDQKIICSTYKRIENEAEEVLQVLVPETCATYKCKEKAPTPEPVGQPGLANSLERSSRADFHAFFSMLAGKKH